MASDERVTLEAVNAGFDTIFAQHGLEGKSYILGRQYHGVVAGREAHIYLNPQHFRGNSRVGHGQYRGHDLSIYLASPLKTRLQLTQASAVNDWLIPRMGLEPVPALELTLADLQLSALDVSWAQELVNQSQETMTRLVTPQKGCGMASLMIYPEAVSLSLRCWHSSIDAEAVMSWLSDLDHLATSAERLPATQHPVEETTKDRNIRLRDSSQVLKGGIIVGAVLVAVIAVMAMAMFLIR